LAKAPSDKFQMQMVLSSDPEANNRPSGDQSMRPIQPAWFLKVRRSLKPLGHLAFLRLASFLKLIGVFP
jgi:hypothetical protein